MLKAQFICVPSVLLGLSGCVWMCMSGGDGMSGCEVRLEADDKQNNNSWKCFLSEELSATIDTTDCKSSKDVSQLNKNLLMGAAAAVFWRLLTLKDEASSCNHFFVSNIYTHLCNDDMLTCRKPRGPVWVTMRRFSAISSLRCILLVRCTRKHTCVFAC